MKQIGHECIKAFAGSGKTYTLVIRYIRLLALGVEPARINALTFTRKASGEFLQRIFLMLMKAAGDANEAKNLAAQIGQGQFQPGDFLNLLIRMIQDIGKLQLGTIDSFFARLVGAFPYELGLSRRYRIMDEFEYGLARQSSMEAMLWSGDEQRNAYLLQLYKNLTWGTEEKNVYRIFQEKFSSHHALYQEVDDRLIWGDFNTIFKSKPWWFNTDADIGKIVREGRTMLCNSEYGKRLETAFGKLLDEFENWSPGNTVSGGTILAQLIDQHCELKSGTATVSYYGKDYHIDAEFGQQLLLLIQIFLTREISRRSLLTQALGELLADFDNFYHQKVRETGNLVFSDFPALLIKGLLGAAAAFNPDDIVYRLDSQSDHWLLDEFQDTSRIQWKVLSLFIDEVIQDAEKRRSFFYVGDIKQSIYTWRGGDPMLFNAILDHYNSNETVIQTRPLVHSWRSSPSVLESVNQVFGRGITEISVGKDVAERWSADWLDHKASEKTSNLDGYTGWGLVEDKDSIGAACAELIAKITPLQRNLSTSVLVRTNKEVLEITQALRSAGIPASMEGVDYITRDNFIGRWLIAFMQNLIHPENPFFAEYLCMSGISFNAGELNRLSGLVRWSFTTEGYAGGIQRLVGFLRSRIQPTPFLNHRCEQIVEAATRYDALNNKSLERFIRYLDEYNLSESSLTDQVQVMTVHKAKGLDFDMVIVAGFGGEPVTGRNSEDLHVNRNSDGEVEWILDMPPKQVYEADEVLSHANRLYMDTQMYEALCILYVAMTRARQGLYCIAGKPSNNSSSTTWHDLFSTLKPENASSRQEGIISWQTELGNRDWYAGASGASDTAREEFILQRLEHLPSQKPFRHKLSSPSAEAHAKDRGISVLRDTSGKLFGTRVHDFLATIEWIDPAGMETVLSGAAGDFRQRIKRLFESDLGQAVFMKPEYRAELWREKPYVLRKENQVAHGIIDRAIIRMDENGYPVCMTIYDFKTDTLDPGRSAGEQLMEKYHLQLERYREAAAALKNLPAEKIQTILVPV